MKQYDNHFAVAVMICLKEIIFYISSYLNFRVGKYTIFLFSTVGRNIAANSQICESFLVLLVFFLYYSMFLLYFVCCTYFLSDIE